jgi:hypothetical protein
MVYEFMLVLTIVVAGVENRTMQVEMPSLEECFDHAQRLLADDPKVIGGPDASAVGAGCFKIIKGDPA